MALLTDEETKKELYDRLKEYTQFGMVFKYMLEIEKINISDIEKILFEKNIDKASISYSKILKVMTNTDIEGAFKLYSNEYPNFEELSREEYVSKLNKNCLNSIIEDISNQKNNTGIDKTYLNTYNYLLGKDVKGNYIRR